eukprot:scaffold16564_cov136-Isochrysis_galbana.AAC.1
MEFRYGSPAHVEQRHFAHHGAKETRLADHGVSYEHASVGAALNAKTRWGCDACEGRDGSREKGVRELGDGASASPSHTHDPPF